MRLTRSDLWRLIYPVIGGALFWLSVKGNHILFNQGVISAGGAGLIEVIALAIAFMLILKGVASAISFARTGRWGLSALSVGSCLIGLFLIGAGFAAGAALLTAT